MGILGSRGHDPARPTVGVVIYRAHVLAGNTPRRRATVPTRSSDEAPTHVVVYVLLAASRAGAARTGGPPAAAGRRRGRDHHVGGRRGGAGGRRRRRRGPRGEGWASPLDALDVPVVQAIRRRRRSATEWRRATPGSRPSTWPPAVAIPEFDGRDHRPVVRLQRGGRRRRRPRQRRCSPHRTVPDRRRAGGRPRRRATPGCGARRPADTQVAIVLSRVPDQAQPARQRRRPRHARPVCSRLLDALRGRRLPDRSPSDQDGDELMADLADGLTYDAGSLTAEQLVDGRRAPRRSTTTSAWFATLPAEARDEVERPGGRPRARSPSTTVTSCSPASTSAACWWPSSRPAASATTRSRVVPLPRPAAAPPLPRLLPMARRGLGRRRHRAPRQARHPRVAAGQGASALSAGLLPRRRPRRRAALLPVRRERPGRGHPGQAPGPRRGRSTTSCRR